MSQLLPRGIWLPWPLMRLNFLQQKEFYRYLRTMVEAGYGKRIMFGSDHTVWPQIIEKVILAIDEAEFLTAEQKQDIFYNNAVRFFRLTEADLKK